MLLLSSNRDVHNTENEKKSSVWKLLKLTGEDNFGWFWFFCFVEQRFLLCTLTSGMRPLCRFVTRTIKSQSITSQLEQSTRTEPRAPCTEPFCLVGFSVSQEPATSDSRFHNGWRMPRLLITYDYPVQKLERISIYIDEATTQKTSMERVYQGQIQVSH